MSASTLQDLIGFFHSCCPQKLFVDWENGLLILMISFRLGAFDLNDTVRGTGVVEPGALDVSLVANGTDISSHYCIWNNLLILWV